MKIYVASSWRNEQYDGIIDRLESEGFSPFNFKKAKNAARPSGVLDPTTFVRALDNPRVSSSFSEDMTALALAHACLLILPCGRSAHLELGYAVGAGKATVILLDDPISSPETMYKMADHISTTLDDAVEYLKLVELRINHRRNPGTRVDGGSRP